MYIKLKPCPFCGEKAVMKIKDHRYHVRCSNIMECPAVPTTLPCESEEKAANDWNNRSDPQYEDVKRYCVKRNFSIIDNAILTNLYREALKTKANSMELYEYTIVIDEVLDKALNNLSAEDYEALLDRISQMIAEREN